MCSASSSSSSSCVFDFQEHRGQVSIQGVDVRGCDCGVYASDIANITLKNSSFEGTDNNRDHSSNIHDRTGDQGGVIVIFDSTAEMHTIRVANYDLSDATTVLLFAKSIVTIHHSNISHNSVPLAYISDSSVGPGILAFRDASVVNIEDSTIAHNQIVRSNPHSFNAERPGATVTVDTSSINIKSSRLHNNKNFGFVGGGKGGVMWISPNSPFSISYCQFVNNSAAVSGGAVFISIQEDVVASVVNCLFQGNYAGKEGGAVTIAAVAFLSAVNVNESVFYNNYASSGGAIYATGSQLRLDLDFVECLANSAYFGGCLWVVDVQVVAQNCTIRKNEAILAGGACYVSSGSLFVAIQSVLEHNHAEEGGVLSVQGVGAVVILNDTVFRYNHARTKGGVMHLGLGDRVDIEIVGGCKFVNNYASNGGAFYVSLNEFRIQAVSWKFSGDVTFSNNSATSECKEHCSATGTGGFGGAIYIENYFHCIYDNFTLYPESKYSSPSLFFVNNVADVAGGAVFFSVPNGKDWPDCDGITLPNPTYSGNAAAYGHNQSSDVISFRHFHQETNNDNDSEEKADGGQKEEQDIVVPGFPFDMSFAFEDSFGNELTSSDARIQVYMTTRRSNNNKNNNQLQAPKQKEEEARVICISDLEASTALKGSRATFRGLKVGLLSTTTNSNNQKEYTTQLQEQSNADDMANLTLKFHATLPVRSSGLILPLSVRKECPQGFELGAWDFEEEGSCDGDIDDVLVCVHSPPESDFVSDTLSWILGAAATVGVLILARRLVQEKKTNQLERELNTFLRNPLREAILETDVKRVRLLGKGAFGDVYLGIYAGSEVAVKEISEINLAFDQEFFMESFAREGEAAQALRHRNVVQCIGLLTNSAREDLKGIVTEYCARGALSDTLFSPLFPPLSLKMKARIAFDVIQGLVFLHAQGWLHRDLKCQNVLLDFAGVAKLADFGLSKLDKSSKHHHNNKSKLRNNENKDDDDDEEEEEQEGKEFLGGYTGEKKTSSSSGSRRMSELREHLLARELDGKQSTGATARATGLVGTTGWQAPEMLDLDQPSSYSDRGDMYAFGILLSCLIRGEEPFGETTLDSFAINDAVCRGERPALPSDCPAQWKALIERCWAQDPLDRYTAQEAMNVLGDFQMENYAFALPSNQ